MKLLELPLDIFKIVIVHTVEELGLDQSMKTRLTCRAFANEILEAIITTRAIEDVSTCLVRLIRINHHPKVIARYLYHRVCTDGAVTHPWITTIRETVKMFMRNTASEDDPARGELLTRSACLCLAVNSGYRVFEVINQGARDEKLQHEGGTRANCLAIAAWIGEKFLVESFNEGSDPPSFFGRPSWAAAAQGHVGILKFFLDQGASSYEPTFIAGPDFNLSKSSIAVAAYMGHENIVRLYLQPQYFCSGIRHEELTAIIYAAMGNQPTTLKLLLKHYKESSTTQEFTYAIDCALIRSCKRRSFISTQILLNYGADTIEAHVDPSSLLSLTVFPGNTEIIKMVLNKDIPTRADSIVS